MVYFSTIEVESTFICPECSSTEIESEEFLSLEPTKTQKKQNPWASVLQIIRCASCKNKIPSHLGERWNNLSIQEAQQEWKSKYKKK